MNPWDLEQFWKVKQEIKRIRQENKELEWRVRALEEGTQDTIRLATLLWIHLERKVFEELDWRLSVNYQNLASKIKEAINKK